MGVLIVPASCSPVINTLPQCRGIESLVVFKFCVLVLSLRGAAALQMMWKSFVIGLKMMHIIYPNWFGLLFIVIALR